MITLSPEKKMTIVMKILWFVVNDMNLIQVEKIKGRVSILSNLPSLRFLRVGMSTLQIRSKNLCLNFHTFSTTFKLSYHYFFHILTFLTID